MLANRVKETTATTGTGSFTTAGAVAGFVTFNTAFGTNRKFHYWAVNETNDEWETGIGYLSASTTLVRDTVLSSTNSDAAVNFTTAPSLFCAPSESAFASIVHAANNSVLPGYTPSVHVTEETTNLTMVANRVYYSPFLYLGQVSTFSGFQVRVATAAASSLIRISLYDASGDFKPETKIVTCTSDFDSSTTGTKTQACTATTIYPGWYFVCYSSDGTPAIRQASQQVFSPLGIDSSNNINKCYTENGADISHPAAPTLAGTSANFGATHIGLNIA